MPSVWRTVRGCAVWLILIPLAVFVAAFAAGAVMLRLILKQSKALVTETSAGKALHVESPLIGLDMRPEKKLDPRLAQIPLYPGAMPENPASAEVITKVRLGFRDFQDISASYWTPDNVKQVWEFYRQQLPDWPRNLVESQGKELIHSESDCVRLIRVSGQGERTVIETSIKPPGYPNNYQ